MKILTLAILLAAAPVVATAQDRGVSSQQNNDLHAYQDQFNQNLHTNALEQQQDNYRDTQNPRRIRRAQEAAALINKGDCDGARAVATRANDDRLLQRVDQVCAPGATPAPVPATAPTGQ